MKFSKIIFQLPDLLFLFFLLYIIPLSCGQNMSTHSDSVMNITKELRDKITKVWCHGENYTALCHGYNKVHECFGELVQGEFLSVNNDTSLYAFKKGELGDILKSINCTVEKTSQYSCETSFVMGFMQWGFIVFLLFGCVVLIRMIYRINKFSLQNWPFNRNERNASDNGGSSSSGD